MGTRVLNNDAEYLITSSSLNLNSRTTFGGRVSDITIEALRQSGVFGGRFSEPSDTAPTDTTLIWIDTSAVTETNQVPATIRRYDSGTSTWVVATFEDIFGDHTVSDLVFESSGTTFLQQTQDTGAASVSINPLPSDGTSIATVAMFRDTNTTGEKRLRGNRGNGTATNPFFQLSTDSNNYVCALDTTINGPNFAVGAEGSINQYKLLVSRIDYLETDTDNEHNHLCEFASDNEHSSSREGPIVDLIRGGNPSNVLTPSVNLPAAGNLLGCLRFTGRNTNYDAIRYGGIHAFLNDPTPSTEDGSLLFKTIFNGTYDTRVRIARGMWSENASGDPGIDVINFLQGWFQNGVSFDGGTTLLSNYSEGTFTPEFADAASGGNTASGTFEGRYTRVGRMVDVQIRCVNIDTAGMTGANDIFIRGLPFTAVNSGFQYAAAGTVVGHSIDYTTNYTEIKAVVPGNTSYLNIVETGSGQADQLLTVAAINSSADDLEIISIRYEVA